MPFVDLQFAAPEAFDSGGTEIDLVHYRYTRVLVELLPPGRAFGAARRAGTRLRRLLAGLGMEWSRLQRGIDQMLREAQPATATASLPMWETLLGLPDCEEPTTLAGRRVVAHAKLGSAGGHTQEVGYWEALFEGLGYEITSVFDFRDFIADCEGPCDMGLFDELWVFAVWLFTAHGDNDAVLACRVGAEQLLGFSVELKWQWNMVDAGAVALRAVGTSQDGWTVAVGLAGEIRRSKEYLDTWELVSNAIPMDMHAVTCAGGSVMVAVGQAGVGCLRSIDGGENWVGEVFFSAALYGISRSYEDTDEVIAVGGSGEIWKAAGGGAVWSQKTSPVASTLRAVTRATGVLVAVGDGGVVLRSVDAGESWTAGSSGTTSNLYGVAGWGSTIIAVGADGTLARSDDGGLSWTAKQMDTSEDLYAVTASPGGERWTACGASGLIAQSLDEGLSWSLTTISANNLTGAATGALLGRAVLVGDAGGHIVLE